MRRSRALHPVGLEEMGNEYQVISLLPSWGALSAGAAVIAILSRPILGRLLFDWLGWRPENPYSWPVAVAALSFSAALVGLVMGWMGLRSGRGSRTLAGVGVLANATVLALVLLLNVLIVYIRMR